jgi:hypothetical protein
MRGFTDLRLRKLLSREESDDHLLGRSANAQYIVPPDCDRRVAGFSTRSTPASPKSSQSLSKPTGYGPPGDSA